MKSFRRKLYRTLPFLFLLMGCSKALPPEDFSRNGPAFSPDEFFTGRTSSWGMIETRTGAPQSQFATNAIGTRDETGALILTQTFVFADGKTQQRIWRFVKIDEHHFEGTASDVVGTAHGEAYGNLFHWQYTLALKPGNRFSNVDLEQWMYLQEGGTIMVNRATIRKLGFTVGMVTEYFQHLSDTP